ncbi:MAG: ATP-dependent Clp protease adapter protein ClpS [Alphaproteobacteria bacterium MarineAlpha5_Bin9]|nr:MAG: ATP-dependent Clp protease adapter protein ClpS [Alphaproteobacteria bacterium MarineAlpha5_Bin9]|tara:strand:+ start:26376 stop:26702 length:327 start_codon:yes stop_codon:yes gene_type:complete
MNNRFISDFNESEKEALLEKSSKLKKPSYYKVLLLNDDYTPMEFVVHILKKFFNKSEEDATKIMLHVHQSGIGICGIYTYEIAESKCKSVIEYSKKNQHPLQCNMEKS